MPDPGLEGSVLAVPDTLARICVMAALVSLVALWLAAPGIRRGRNGTARFVRRLRVAVAAGAAAVLGASWLLATVPSLAPGHSWGGDDPRLIASLDELDGPRSAALLYAYAPNAELRSEVSIVNDGAVPVTILGLDPTTNPFVAELALRLPPTMPADQPLLLYPDAAGDPWYSEPFAPFELASGTETTLAVSARLVDCGSIAPLPTRAPGADLASEKPPGSGFGVVEILPIRYSALGIERHASIPLFAPMEAAVGVDSWVCDGIRRAVGQ